MEHDIIATDTHCWAKAVSIARLLILLLRWQLPSFAVAASQHTQSQSLQRCKMSTQSDFDAKVAFVKKWTYGGSKVTNAEKLACYGLYKQVTVGDNTTPQPWAVQMEARAKWDAWASRKGMSKPDAIAAYIAEVDSQHAKYGDGP